MPDITEQQVYEALGLPGQDAGQGAQEQPSAETAAQTSPQANTGEGEKAQEVAAPAQENAESVTSGAGTEPTADAEEPEDGQKNADADADDDKSPLTPEQRRANAARRRQQEQQAAIDQAVSAALQAEREKNAADMKDFFTAAGIKNTFTGQIIGSMEEFKEWKAKFDGEQLQKELKAGRLTPELLERAISAHPTVRQAAAVAQASEAAKQQAQQAADKAKIDAEIAEISKMDPTVQKVEDLLTMPTAKEFYAAVQRGNSFLDAFKLANHDRLLAASAEAARQQALNNTRSKDHLSATGNTRGTGMASVPPDQLAMFRAFMPNASDAEIQAYWNNYQKSKGG